MAAKEIRFMLKRINLRKKRRQSTLIIFVIALLFVFALSTNVFAKVLNLGTPTDSVYVQGNLGVGTSAPLTKLMVNGTIAVNGGNYDLIGGNDVLGGVKATLSGWDSCPSGAMTDRNVGTNCMGPINATAEWDTTSERYNLDGGSYSLFIGGHWFPGDIISGGTDDNIGFNIDFWDSGESVWRTAGSFIGWGWHNISTPTGIGSGDTTKIRLVVTDTRGGTARIADVRLFTTQIAGEWTGTFVGSSRGYFESLSVGSSEYMQSNGNLTVSGNIGIAVTNPSQKLHVNGAAQLDAVSYGVTPGESQTLALSTVEYVNSKVGGSGGVASGTSGQTLRHDGTSWIASSILYNNGTNVGIGVTSPSQKLHVSGKVYSDSVFVSRFGLSSSELYNTAQTKQIYGLFGSITSGVDDTFGNLYGIGYSYSTLGGAAFASQHNIVFTSAGVVKATIGTGNGDLDLKGKALIAGNVGIGTTNPVEKLQVSGNLRVGGADNGNFIAFRGTTGDSPGSFINTYIGERIFSGTESSELFIFKGNDYAGSGPDRVRIGAAEFRVDTYNAALSGAFETVASSASLTNRFIVTNNGNVGINVASPSQKLHVNGGAQLDAISFGTTPGESQTLALTTVEYVNAKVGGSGGIASGTSGQTLRHDGTSWVANSLLYNNGTNIGIGYTNPARDLVLAESDSGDAVMQFQNLTTGYTAIDGLYLGVDANEVAAIWNYENTGMDFGTNNTSRMFITSNGNVGVGTTAPSQKLEIADSGTYVYVKDSTGILARNYVNSYDWNVGGTGGTPMFTQNGDTAENSREWGIGPHGNRVILWKASPDAVSGPDGGWNSDYFNIDHTKTYRYAVWIKKTGSSNGSTYFGTNGGGASLLTLAGVANGNPYFWSGDLPQLDKWYLLIGYVHGSGDTSTINYGGIYDGETGQKVVGITDFKFQPTTTTTLHRTYLYYDTDINDRQYFWDPRVEEVTGFEPTVEALLGLDKGSTQGINRYFGGNVGINTTSPTQKLHVAGVAQLDSISFGVTPGSGQTLALATVEYVNNSVSASGGLWSENGTNIYYNSGNVGVGTSAPAGNFDVANASSILLGGASATLRLTSTANTMWLQGLNATRNGTVNNITFSGYSGANRTLDIDLINQRVGIGTSAPAYNLDVTGTLRVTDAAYFDKTTFIKDSNGTVDSWWGWYAWDKEFQFNKRSSTNTFVQNIFTANWDTGNFNLVPTSGNVGVYRATPTAKLDVNGSFISTSATVSNLAGSGNTFVMSDNSGNLYTQDGITFKRTAIADASYSAQASDYIIAYTSLTADRTVTLPTSVCTSGRAYIIVNETGGAFNVVVDPESTATISGMTSISLPAYNSIPVYCNGTNWFIY